MQAEQILDLEIDGVRAPQGEYALRWNDGQGRRDLYRDGRRVTKPWRVVVQLTNPGDPFGGNANTDG